MTFVFEFEYLMVLTISMALHLPFSPPCRVLLKHRRVSLILFCPYLEYFQQHIHDVKLFKFFKLNNSALFAESHEQSFGKIFLKRGRLIQRFLPRIPYSREGYPSSNQRSSKEARGVTCLYGRLECPFY